QPFNGSPNRSEPLYIARQNACEAQQWVENRKDARLEQDGPPPSQRSSQSFSALYQFAESVETCRHVSICRYFGEVIDTKDVEVLKRYCDNMCDVCKYPEKTRRRVKKLSTEVVLKKIDLNTGRHQAIDAWSRANLNLNKTNVMDGGRKPPSGARTFGMTKRAPTDGDRQALGTSAKKAKVSYAMPSLGQTTSNFPPHTFRNTHWG
ncbi:hypothetical protein H0H93_007453, partial [Arthromyces matolae]